MRLIMRAVNLLFKIGIIILLPLILSCNGEGAQVSSGVAESKALPSSPSIPPSSIPTAPSSETLPSETRACRNAPKLIVNYSAVEAFNLGVKKSYECK